MNLEQDPKHEGLRFELLDILLVSVVLYLHQHGQHPPPPPTFLLYVFSFFRGVGTWHLLASHISRRNLTLFNPLIIIIIITMAYNVRWGIMGQYHRD